MRAKDDFKRKTKNSFIYFQLGLIAAMVVTLFILESNFKEVIKKSDTGTIWEPVYDSTFVYNPAEPEAPTKVKPIAPKKIASVEPRPKVELVDKFDVKDDEEKVVKQDLGTQDEPEVDKTSVDTNPVASNTATATGGTTEPMMLVTVEQLPMFKACKGLARSEQKACFDEQLAKAISKNLVYPERDFDNRKQGTALIEFIIDENGNITNVKPLENNRATEDMKKAAEKAVKKIPQLIPAKQGTKNVKIKYAIPITFRLN
ncbi:TonB family protein [Flavobacterium sp. TP390]|uniref:TonB family protein n=1 Tax=Flavobacterium profundi TaxID=1774945 RepID=A0A6I4IGL2_9FLAO|nr:TonB family protein [Flavobacterium profundi]MVO08835.1 TonB family protein [Flavobacterium profundi]